jgi:elongation factor P hydroxylase
VGWTLAGIADFNGDDKPDYLLFNPSTRASMIWYLSGATRIGSASGPSIAAGYNLTGAADFDGNGKPDYVLYNTSTRRTLLLYMDNNVLIGSAFGPTLPPGWIVAAP